MTSKKKHLVELTINNREYSLVAREDETLLELIREGAGLTGTKCGCNKGECGACTVIYNGRAVNSCSIPALMAEGSVIQTIEGLAGPEGLHPLQRAFIDTGAIQCGFCTPGMIMAAKALLDRTPNPTSEQIREAMSGNLCRCTGYTKIEEAIRLAIRHMQDPASTSMVDTHNELTALQSAEITDLEATRRYRTVAHPIPRMESEAKATGRAIYAEDITLPGMVYGLVIRSPHAHARVLSIDLGEAEKCPGYLGALLPEEVPNMRYNCSGNPPSALLMADEFILTRDILCVGDRILAIAAESPEQLEPIAQAVKIEYELLPPITTIKDALKPDACVLQPHLSDTNIIASREVIVGDIDEGLKQAAHVYEDSFVTAPMQHTAMEMTTCLCDFSDSNKLTIYSNSQTPFQERRIMAELFSMSENDIHIIKPIMGGGFGARQQLHNQPAIALLSRKLRRPIRMVNTREEELYASVVRHGMETTLRFGVAEDGHLTTFATDYYVDGGPYTTHTPTVVAAAARKFQYHVDNYQFRGYSIATTNPTAGAFRGYGNAQLAFGRELMLSRIARELGYDPVEYRLMNHTRVGEHFPGATAPVTSCAIEACAKKALAIQAQIDAAEGLIDNDEIRQAWGIAFCCHGSGPSSKEGMSSAILVTNDDGTLRLYTGSADIGQGSETMLCQIAAETLGIPLSSLQIIAANTRLTPYDTGTFGSSQTFVSGNAVVLACEDLIRKTTEALRFYYDDPDIRFGEDKSFHLPSAGECFDLSEAVRRVIFGMKGKILIGDACYKALASPNPFAVCMCKAEYGKKTNTITLRHLIEVADVGTPINTMTVLGQLEGGVAQGVGYVLTEGLEYNKRVKKVSSSDLLHYRIPEFGDLPTIHAALVDSYEPTGPLGAKSVGELATVPVAPAIVDAVSLASGRKLNRIPLSHEFIIQPNRRSQAERDKED